MMYYYSRLREIYLIYDTWTVNIFLTELVHMYAPGLFAEGSN